MVVLSGIAGTAWNALFNVVPSQKRGQVLAFQNGVPSQIGVALSGLLLVLGDKVLTAQQVLLMGMVVTLVCGFLVWKMRNAYGQALIDALRAGRLEVFNLEDAGFTGLQGDMAALNVATRALEDPKPTARRLAAEILGKMQNASAIPALTHRLSDPDAGVRAGILQALGELHASAAIDKINASLNDDDPEVRFQALVALSQIDVQPSDDLIKKIETLFADGSINVRMQAVITLVNLGRGKDALPELTKWMQPGDPALRIAAFETFGRVAVYSGGQIDASPILSALDDPLSRVRAAACLALKGIKDDAVTLALVSCLSDTDESCKESCGGIV